MKYIKLSQYAKNMGISYRTAQNWFYANNIENAIKMESGTILVGVNESKKETKSDYVVIYSRVSTPNRKEDLDRQANRLLEYSMSKGYTIHEIIKEVASGLNDNRPKLNKILNDDKVTKIVVEHKDRLTRFGFNYIETLSKRLGIDVEVVNLSKDIEDDIMTDLVSIINSFCARIYGKRRAKFKTIKIMNNIK